MGDLNKIVKRSLDWINNVVSDDSYKFEELAPGVRKYLVDEDEIVHMLVYLDDGLVTEFSVYCGDCSFTLEEIREKYSKELSGYNFRENYTQYLFETDDKEYKKIAFIIDDNVNYDENSNKYIVKSPKGNKSYLDELMFNGFVLKRG